MVSIICKCLFRSGQYEVHLQLFCKSKLQSRQKGRAVTQMDCSNTLSEFSFHGLPSESKRHSIRKQIASPLSLQLIILFLRNSHLQRDNQQTFFSQFFFNFQKILAAHQKSVLQKFLECSPKNTRGESYFSKTQAFTCKFSEISKNTFFTEHLRTTASAFSFSKAATGGVL